MPIENAVLRAPEAARRMADTIALHQVVLGKDALIAGRYAAIRLADGGSDGVAYDSRAEAITYQRHNASRCLYVRIPLERWSPATCDTLLWYTRGCYDSGYRQDPNAQLVVSNMLENLR